MASFRILDEYPNILGIYSGVPRMAMKLVLLAVHTFKYDSKVLLHL